MKYSKVESETMRLYILQKARRYKVQNLDWTMLKSLNVYNSWLLSNVFGCAKIMIREIFRKYLRVKEPQMSFTFDFSQ